MRILRSASRGQSLTETLLFLPAVLVLLFGTFYVSQFGVAAERVQSAVRYGGTATFDAASSSIFSIARAYTGITTPAMATCPTPPPGIVTGSAPLPGPSSAPYWQPTSITTTCTMITTPRANGGFIAAATETTTATMPLPQYLSAIGASTTATASQSFVHPADPGAVIYCSTVVRTRMSSALSPAGASPLPAATPMSATTSSSLVYACP